MLLIRTPSIHPFGAGRHPDFSILWEWEGSCRIKKRESVILRKSRRKSAHAGKHYTVLDSAKKKAFFVGNLPVLNRAWN
jgi:hypothetical protein